MSDMSAEVLAVGTQLADGRRITYMSWTGECWSASVDDGVMLVQRDHESGVYGRGHLVIPWPPPPLKPGDVVSVEGRVVRWQPESVVIVDLGRGWKVHLRPEDVTLVEPYVEPEVLAVGMELVSGFGAIEDLLYSDATGEWVALIRDGSLSQRGCPTGLELRGKGRLPWPPKPEAAS